LPGRESFSYFVYIGVRGHREAECGRRSGSASDQMPRRRRTGPASRQSNRSRLRDWPAPAAGDPYGTPRGTTIQHQHGVEEPLIQPPRTSSSMTKSTTYTEDTRHLKPNGRGTTAHRLSSSPFVIGLATTRYVLANPPIAESSLAYFCCSLSFPLMPATISPDVRCLLTSSAAACGGVVHGEVTFTTCRVPPG
jgi:hypothetical protein